MDFLVFSYGTLQPEFAPKEISATVSKLKTLGQGSVRGSLFDLGEYPALKIRHGSTTMVKGTVFQVPSESIMHRLDEFEGFNRNNPTKSLFIRQLLKVRMQNGTTRSCWVYVYNREPTGARYLRGGEYKGRRTKPKKRQPNFVSGKQPQMRAGD